MKNRMTIDGQHVPVGNIDFHFQYFVDDGPPHAWIDIVANSDDDDLAGLAINCLDIGDIPELEMLYSTEHSFGDAEQADGAELAESVFWRPGGDTLEIEDLKLVFGHPTDGRLPITVSATCVDFESDSNVAVVVETTVNVDQARG
jgi:hypothetical protein